MRPIHSSAVICPTLIGRAEQMNLLLELNSRVSHGHSQLALITGEAGVGKSRLVAELTTVAAQRGVNVVQGRCFEQDRSFPYAPVIDLLRACYGQHSTAAIERLFGPIAAELVKLLPELALSFPNLAPTPVDEPEQEKRRLFQALLRFLRQLATTNGASTQQPLLLVFEDLHWADDTSLEWLLYLVRHVTTQPLLVLLTYRHDEEPLSLKQVLAALDRLSNVSELFLAPLTPTDVNEMLQAIFQLARPPRADFLNTLYTFTEGNPFFIEEVLKSLITHGAIYQVHNEWVLKPMRELQIPRTVQVAMQQRMSQLSPAAQQVLTIAAVAGQRFAFAVLQAITQQPEHDLLPQLKELIAAQLIVEESVEFFAFRHTLTRQAIYTSLLGRERRALHRALAEALTTCYAHALDLYASELAHHLYEAGLWAQALVWAQRAGAQAEALYAYGEALSHYNRARDCAVRVGDPAQVVVADCNIGQVRGERGEHTLAIEAYERALHATPDRAQRGVIKSKLGAAYVQLADQRSVVYLHEALSELDPATQAQQISDATLSLVFYHHLCAQYTQALGYLERVRPHIEQRADPTNLQIFYSWMAIVLMYSARFTESMPWARRCVALGETHHHMRALVSGYLYLSESSEYLGRWQETKDFANLGRQFAQQAGWQNMEVWTALECVAVAYYQGDLTTGSQLAHECLALANELHERRAILHIDKLLVQIETALGHEETAYVVGAAAVQAVDEVVGVGVRCWVRLALAGLHLQREEWNQALALYEQCIELLAAGENRILQMELGAPMAEAYAALGRLPEAAELIATTVSLARATGARHYEAVAWRVQGQIYQQQTRYAESLLAYGQAIAICTDLGSRLELAHGFYQRGLLHQAQQDFAAAQADWADACALCEQMGAQALRWRLHAALGKLAQAQQRDAEAQRQFASARGIVARLSAKMKEATHRQNLAQRAAALLPAESTTAARRAASEEFGGLTPREREVAILIAQGHSNREIAQTLVISERTVTTHISNIFNKLGYTSRTQIATWAGVTGLWQAAE